MICNKQLKIDWNFFFPQLWKEGGDTSLIQRSDTKSNSCSEKVIKTNLPFVWNPARSFECFFYISRIHKQKSFGKTQLLLPCQENGLIALNHRDKWKHRVNYWYQDIIFWVQTIFAINSPMLQMWPNSTPYLQGHTIYVILGLKFSYA